MRKLNESLEGLKRDTEEIYDVAFGNYYRENHKLKTIITPEEIAGNRRLNELLDIILDDAIELGAMNIDISLDRDGYGLVEMRIGRDMVRDRILDKDA